MESKTKKPAHRGHCIVERGRPCTLSLETSKGRRYNGVRCHWRLAKVVGTMASEDNLVLVRKVRLLMSDPTLAKTGKRVKEPTYLERPIHKLVLLLPDSNDDDV